MKRVAGAQEALERQLSILEVHQTEIHSALEGMQREAQQLYEKEGVRPDEASRERDLLFDMAEDVSRQLADIGASLRDTMQLVNSQAAASDPTADPLSAAVQILNNQLSSLVWIDTQAKQLARRVDTICE
jgi:nuclear pore complex protein Nup62